MTDFESMTDEEFNSYLCEPVRVLDQHVRQASVYGGFELVDDYRKQLVEYDRICMEPVQWQ